MKKSLLILLLLSSCGQDKRFYSTCDELLNQICITYSEGSCDYFLDDICIKEQNRFLEIDKFNVVTSFLITEEKVNVFYPGLNLFDLAGQVGLSIDFCWQNGKVSTYYDSLERIEIIVRWNTTSRIRCMDKYFILAHELLHFVDFYHVPTNLGEVEHMTPHLFIRWEMVQSSLEGRNYDETNSVEGLIYAEISGICGYGE